MKNKIKFDSFRGLPISKNRFAIPCPFANWARSKSRISLKTTPPTISATFGWVGGNIDHIFILILAFTNLTSLEWFVWTMTATIAKCT